MTEDLREQALAMLARLPGVPAFLGLTITVAQKDRVVAEMTIRQDHCTEADSVHGGVMMAYADTIGALGTCLNLKDKQATTTIESKSNFFAGTPLGAKPIAESVPLHRGRRTQVWETRLLHENGRLAAKITHTQIVIDPK
jgi:1,4-dihydroxy-2-naphthoyl-CoA hydrolase